MEDASIREVSYPTCYAPFPPRDRGEAMRLGTILLGLIMSAALGCAGSDQDAAATGSLGDAAASEVSTGGEGGDVQPQLHLTNPPETEEDAGGTAADPGPPPADPGPVAELLG